MIEVGSKKAPNKQTNNPQTKTPITNSSLPVCMPLCHVILPFLLLRDGCLFLLLESGLDHIDCFSH